MTREQKINKGKLWIIHPDSDGDKILFEGSKTSCVKYLKENKLWGDYKKGVIRLGQLIWENGPKEA